MRKGINQVVANHGPHMLVFWEDRRLTSQYRIHSLNKAFRRGRLECWKILLKKAWSCRRKKIYSMSPTYQCAINMLVMCHRKDQLLTLMISQIIISLYWLAYHVAQSYQRLCSVHSFKYRSSFLSQKLNFPLQTTVCHLETHASHLLPHCT